jgi:AcrR family transcriptional regulator
MSGKLPFGMPTGHRPSGELDSKGDLLQTTHSRAPKQRRSRESYDRMIDAAIEILQENGLHALTLAEVSRRSRVSIGSIYCRVKSKEDLIRAMQTRALGEMEKEFAALVNRVRRRALPLRELVPAIVRELALYLRRHATLLTALMQRGAEDPVVEATGRKSFLQTALDFRLVLLERHGEFRHQDPERAASTCFIVVYGALARYLGLGAAGAADGAREGDWNQLVKDLGLMALAFLLVDLEQLSTSGRKSAR